MMASFFGEIIEPSSRAIFDDYSDEEDDSRDLKLELTWIQSNYKLPSVFDVIFIYHSRLSLAFAELFMLDKNEVPAAEIHITNNKNELDKINNYAPKILPSRIFINQNTVTCLISPSFLPELGYQFTETIKPLLEISKKVVVFTSESLYNYKTPSLQDLLPAFIKELKTQYMLEENKAEPLQVPNFITGIPGGVISWCEIYKKPASAYVCYTDQPKLDSITASPFLAVLKKIKPDCIKNEHPNFDSKIFYGTPGNIGGSSNIYI